MNNTNLTNMDIHQHLGVTFSNNCSWTEHIKSIANTAWVRLNLLRSMKFKINRKPLIKMYIAFIHPLMEYSASVWDNCTLENKKLLDSVHKEAAKIITGATKLCSVDKMLAELGWETLQERSNKQKHVIFYNMLHNEAPTYLFTASCSKCELIWFEKLEWLTNYALSIFFFFFFFFSITHF